MAWFRAKSTNTAEVRARLPRAAEPGATARFAEQARERGRPGEHGTTTQIFDYLELLRDRSDLPLYSGAGGRPAILLRVSPRLRADLGGLDELVRRKGANLYLQGHRVGRYGLMRAVLELPEYDLIFEAPLTLADGEVQEFVIAAYEQEAVELHLAHAADQRTLRFTFSATGIRPVVDAVLDGVEGAVQPAGPADQAAAADELEARFPKVEDGLTRRTRVRLGVTGTPDGVVSMTESH